MRLKGRDICFIFYFNLKTERFECVYSFLREGESAKSLKIQNRDGIDW